jgi:phage/conjugal plasmid C-4 type zinc finger TraR family protein
VFLKNKNRVYQNALFFIWRRIMSKERDPVDFVVLDLEAQADIYVENMTNNGINNVLRSIPKNVRSLTVCIDCDEDIPEGRQKAYPGVTRCIICQTDFDNSKKR